MIYKEELINDLKVKSVQMMELTFKAVKNSIKSLKKVDIEKVNDDEIDKLYVDVEEQALKILLKERTYSKDLRIVTGILKLVDDIERIGDHAEDLAWCSSKLTLIEKHVEINSLNELCKEVLSKIDLTLESYLNEDSELANKNIELDDNVDDLYLKVLDELEIIKDNESNYNLIIYSTLIAKYLERIADHLVNINEWIIYIKNGYYKGRTII